jgi:RNA polymerase sigma-70 factor (ECF subfamily)
MIAAALDITGRSARCLRIHWGVSCAGAGLDLTNDRLCQLVAAVADGDREAFAQLFRYFAPRLKTFGLRRGADVAAAEELAQETMLAVWRKADTFDPRRATVSAWVFTIVRNKRIDLIRRARYPEADFSEASESPSEDRPPDEALSRSEAGRALCTLMKALPEAELEIVRKAFSRTSRTGRSRRRRDCRWERSSRASGQHWRACVWRCRKDTHDQSSSAIRNAVRIRDRYAE